MKTYPVHFLCNDDRGDFTDRVEQVQISDLIHLVGRPRAFRMLPMEDSIGSFKLGRRTYACRTWRSWVGNLFWDATRVTEDVAVALVRDLLRFGWVVEEYAESGPFAKLARRAR